MKTKGWEIAVRVALIYLLLDANEREFLYWMTRALWLEWRSRKPKETK